MLKKHGRKYFKSRGMAPPPPEYKKAVRYSGDTRVAMTYSPYSKKKVDGKYVDVDGHEYECEIFIRGARQRGPNGPFWMLDGSDPTVMQWVSSSHGSPIAFDEIAELVLDLGGWQRGVHISSPVAAEEVEYRNNDTKSGGILIHRRPQRSFLAMHGGSSRQGRLHRTAR